MASTDGKRSETQVPAAPPEIPDKLYFRIGEVARLLDLPAYVLRFWETEFPQLKPGKGGTGQRLYRRRDVELAIRIKGLLYDEGYTIPGARQHLKGEGRGRETQPAVVPVVVAAAEPEGAGESVRLRRMRSELREIASLLARPTEGTSARPVKAAHGRPHKGLHVAPARRVAEPDSGSLFPEDEPS